MPTEGHADGCALQAWAAPLPPHPPKLLRRTSFGTVVPGVQLLVRQRLFSCRAVCKRFSPLRPHVGEGLMRATVRLHSTRRMRCSSETSAKPPLGSIATPNGRLNLALLPAPLPKPAVPLPASVVTTPVAISTRRMRWLLWSVTSAKTPLGSIATPIGRLNLALLPAPLPKPVESLPASVVTTPVAISTRRMRWLTSSVTSAKTPLGSIATPIGRLNLALLPAPLPKPVEPLPASV